MHEGHWYSQWDAHLQQVFECAPSPEPNRWWVYVNGALLRASSEPLSEQGIRYAMERWGFRAPAGREDPGSWGHRETRTLPHHPMEEHFPLSPYEDRS